jgi:predicted ferric reductase
MEKAMLRETIKEQILTEHDNMNTGTARRSKAARFWKVPVIAAALAVCVAAVLVMLPMLSDTMSGAAPQAYWYISRSTAFVAFGLIWLSMLAGLGITSRLGRFWPGMPGSLELHRFTAFLGIGFGAIHALVLLSDQYMGYTLGQLLLPFISGSYRTAWIGFGQLSFYMLLLMALSFYVRPRLGVHTWRMIHMLSFAMFLMVLVHGMQTGTDSGSVWAQALYWVSAGSVVLGSIYRIMARKIGTSKAAPAAKGLVVAAGRSQARPAGVLQVAHSTQVLQERVQVGR